MICELKPEQYPAVRSLFRELSEYNATLTAVLDGICPGGVVADDPDAPRSALARTAEGSFLSGDPLDEAFVADLNGWLVENLFNDEPTVSGDGIFLRFHPQGWMDRMPALFRPREPMTLVGRHYLLTELGLRDWRDRLPDGFAVRNVDAALLEDPDLSVPDDILEHIDHNWGSRARYLEHGFGLCAVHGDVITHWSVADCATRDRRCEIGVDSRPGYRGRGLAAATVAACVEHALARGFARVGWQCSDDNLGSIRTAERVGFVLERTDTTCYCMLSSVHQEAERGWYHLRNGRPRESAVAYQRLLALGLDLPDHIHHTAARAFAASGLAEMALASLRDAAARGWRHVDFTARCPDFEPLHGAPEWEAILRRMSGTET